MKSNDKYTIWLNAFMWNRLRLGLIIAIISLLSFIVLNLSYYPDFQPSWLYTNLTQEVVLLFCLGLLHSPIGHTRPGFILLVFSWSVSLIPQYWFLQAGIAKLDFITWTLMFLGQATLLPVCWRLHLVSQLGVFIGFFAFSSGFNLPIDTQITNADPIYLYLYLLWVCVICNISVYLYENLQHSEFHAKCDLQVEQEKSDRLLLNILPACIAKRLKQQYSTIADDFSQVTVLFADIVGFTEMSGRMSPIELVKLLNNIFSLFDRLVERHCLEKIKTIGDAYMVVAGLPIPCTNHVEQIADLSLEMQQGITQFNNEHHHDLKIRIGIHTGQVVAGVIGIKKFAYDLWGDTVNIASRMESHGIAGRIQVSDSVYELLKDKYVFKERGKISVKGKGNMTTYFLEGKMGYQLKPGHFYI
ncbi:adenylate/guanylate cyclase domain-containing protein [Candidatus Parabeggiatoa sp. HSG14]|uniref:adenylate/guanylate cyclase domain-containing protein n=1 Tax=Candidatus Parabeggiatoa sp. HSG14 TaxID=3055593 RepID=UPI0025A79203|nr:adenylate/guanylate cyclase domain-containing protein [Thiotrichales bacterium HSG14]